jgi:hypothetical protein
MRKQDKDCEHLLDAAEQHYHAAASSGFEPARFAISHFYRMIFRPLEACRSYTLQAIGLKNPRRRLEASYLYAEAAIQIWYKDKRYIPA